MAVRKSEQKETENSKNKSESWFKIRYLFAFTLILLFILSVYSFDKADLAVLEGGVEEPVKNWIGPVGAWISRFLFYSFGLATYPVILVLFIVCIRTFIRIPRKKVRYYYSAVLAVILGIVIFMAMWPERYIRKTDQLGIGRMERSSLALSGGVVGAFLAAPADGSTMTPPGIIRRYIAEVGTLIVVAVLVIPGLAVIYYGDWHSICSRMLGRGLDTYMAQKKRREEEEGSNDDENIPQEDMQQDCNPSGNIVHENDNYNDMTADGTESDDKKTVNKKSILSNFKSFIGKMEQRPGDEELSPDDSHDGNPDNIDGPAENPVDPSSDAVDPEKKQAADPSRNDAVPTRTYAESKEKYDREKPRPVPSEEPSPVAANSSTDVPFRLPPVSLLEQHDEVRNEDNSHIEQSKERLQQTLESFNIDGRVSQIVVGPRVTRFEITLARGVKVEKVSGISGNIAMELAAPSIRILAPIPGMDAVGIEVPNKVSSMVYIRALMESAAWQESSKGIPIILGRDIAG